MILPNYLRVIVQVISKMFVKQDNSKWFMLYLILQIIGNQLKDKLLHNQKILPWQILD